MCIILLRRNLARASNENVEKERNKKVAGLTWKSKYEKRAGGQEFEKKVLVQLYLRFETKNLGFHGLPKRRNQDITLLNI